jgi:hypothetical protein
VIVFHNSTLVKSAILGSLSNPSDSIESIDYYSLPGRVWIENKDSILFKKLITLDSVMIKFTIPTLNNSKQINITRVLKHRLDKFDFININVVDNKKFFKQRINSIKKFRNVINERNILVELELCKQQFCIPDDEIMKIR